MLRSRIPTIAATLDEQVDGAMRLTAEAVASEARDRVPVESGDLRDAIGVEKDRDGLYAVEAGSPDVFYGHLVEFGAAGRPAQPFLIPAAESVRGRIDDLVRNALRDL